jgi:hypothetical protein
MVETWNMGNCIAATHDEIRNDDRRWAAAAYVGIQSGFGLMPDMEIRNCTACGSTLARALDSTVQGIAVSAVASIPDQP